MESGRTSGVETKTVSKTSRLTFIRETKTRNRGYIICLWKCECGGKRFASRTDVKFGKIVSCGCRIKRIGKDNAAYKHGMFGTRAHKIWDGMIQRCHNPKSKDYKNWGGRGIKVCTRWKSFENFYADMGEPPVGLTLGRIDNDSGYKKSNCEWQTWKQQANNKRNSIKRR